TIAGPIDFAIFGDTTLSPYIGIYEGVGIVYVSPTVFKITRVTPSLPSAGTYTNAGSDLVFARYPNNPYPGPVQWSSDLIDKGIIGDRYFRIPQTATADGTQVANRFNVNGQTGTVFLQNGEVAYVVLERNQVASLGATYSTAGGSAPMIGTQAPTDIHGARLHVGDFVKFQDEDETKWCRISYPPLNIGDQLPGSASTFYLLNDNGQPPTGGANGQREPKTGTLVYSKTTYDVVHVQPHWKVDSSADVYWIAVRRDNGSLSSKVYLKSLELKQGEVRNINDGTTSNLVQYIGAPNEGAINPNYQFVDSTGSWQYVQDLSVEQYPENVDVLTRTVTFASGPDLGFQDGDKVVKTVGMTTYTFTINFVVDSKTAVFEEDVTPLAPSDAVQYHRVNYGIQDNDNLTLAIRKEDRQLASINTALNRPVYDETVFVQQINLGGSGTVKSGHYIYKGPQDAPTALAWVLHGSAATTERIESVTIGMPGGVYGANSILVHIISGTFLHSDSIFQDGVSIGRTINNPGNPTFTAPAILGANNVELVLPPNRRTQTVGSSYIVFPANSFYKASQDPALTGEELLVVGNDQIRQAGLDYSETFGGPKAKIQILRDMPINTRLRFRVMTSFGSALSKLAGNVTLQVAYDGGNLINTISGRPVDIETTDKSQVAFQLGGTMQLDARNGGNVVGGITGAVDQAYDIGSEANKTRQDWKAFDYVKSHNSHPGSALSRFTAADTSTGTSPHVLFGSNITVASNSSIRITATLTARKTGSPFGCASFRMEGTFYNDGSNPVAVAGSPATQINGAVGDGLGYAVAFGLVGSDVVLVVYGIATVEWACGIEYQVVAGA
ncbi:MAG: hypothetical protein ACREGB_02480, partial [Candidatus Saccharimonadales bacterium]